MNIWRFIIIGAILSALVILIGSSRFAWQPTTLIQHYSFPNWNPESPFFHRFAAQDQSNRLLATFSIMATIYLSGILALYAFPEKVRRMKISLVSGGRNLVKFTLLGLLISIVIITIGISSSLTMGTFPLAFFLGSILFVAAFLGFVSLAYALGHYLVIQAGWDSLSPLLIYLLGLILLYTASTIPYLGIPVRAIILMIGIGLATSTRFGSGRSWSLSALQEE